jgi:predicted phosphodiesterase
MEKIAVLADIHGNAMALAAVLENARDRGATAIVNLGDILYGPLEPRHTYDLLLREAAGAITIRGNQDRILYEAQDDTLEENPTMAYVIEDLGSEPLKWLKALPESALINDEVFLCHGCPNDDESYLTEDVSEGYPRVYAEEQIRKYLGGCIFPVIACGHSHLPRLVRLASGQIILNPGSVGLPAFSDEHPSPHRMETFAPFASYAMLEKSHALWQVEFIKVSYDWSLAAEKALLLGRYDWAHGLKTGRVM